MTRIPPLPVDEWSPDMAEFVSGYRSSVASDGPEQGRASGSNLLGTLARYPALTKSFLTFNSHLLRGTSLSTRQRELVVLRVATHRDSDYEWAQHVLLARKAGITDAEIDRVADDPGSLHFAAIERALLAAVDELLDAGTIGEGTWSALVPEFDERQVMDLVFTVGAYSMLAMALRSFGIEPEDELLPHLPAAAGGAEVPR